MAEEARAVSDPLLMAVDLGSSFLKTALFNRQGRLVAGARRAYTERRPATGQIEQDPDEWLTLVADTLEEFREAGIQTARVAGLGLSARGANAIFIDDGGAVLAPCWLDRRASTAAQELARQVGADLDYQTRRLASNTYHFRRQFPDAFPRLAHPLFVKDFLLYRLTGAIATDPSSGPPNGVWPARLWDAVGVPVARLPPVRPHTDVGGTLTAGAAEQLGLTAGLPVGIGGHDGACANIGAGAILPGQSCLTIGTQGVARTIASRPPVHARERRISPYHFLPGRWCCSGDLPRLGAAPTMVAQLLVGGATPGEEPNAALTEAATQVAPGAGGVLYLPFPSGQICPELRPDARAGFLGMAADTARSQLYRAALEGTAYAFRSAIERQQEIGLRVDDIRLSGGGAQNQLWAQILADVLNAPLTVVEPEEGARGAAMLLAVAIGWFRSVEDVAAAWLRPAARYTPSADAVPYERLYRRFRYMADAVYAAERSAPA